MKNYSLAIITGAGASKPYGFPTGTELKELVLEAVSGTTEDFYRIMQVSSSLGYNRGDVVNFHRELMENEFDKSVDAFIESRAKSPDLSKYTAIAKVATALVIAKFEDEKELHDDDWYTTILGKMMTDNNRLDTFKNNKIQFITFNFDRSFEKYMMMKVARQFNITEFEAGTYLDDNFEILHVHGSLGKLWGQSMHTRKGYETTFHSERQIIDAAQNIKFITDAVTDDEKLLIDRAKDIVAKAGLVNFIGLGYHSVNMQRLGFGGSGDETFYLHHNKLFGTFTGLDPIEIDRIRAKYYINDTAPDNRPGVALSIGPDIKSTDIYKYIPTDWD